MPSTDEHIRELRSFDLGQFGYESADEAFAALATRDGNNFAPASALSAVGAPSQAAYFLYERTLGSMDAAEAAAIRDARESSVLIDDLLGEVRPAGEFREFLEEILPFAHIEPADVEDYRGEDYVPPTNLVPGTYHVGAAFSGVESIDEYEDEELYVPSNSFCLFRVVERFFALTGAPREFDRHSIPAEISVQAFRTALKGAKVDMENIPRVLRPAKTPTGWRFVGLSSREPKNITAFAIALMPVCPDGSLEHTGFYHAVLVKNPPLTREGFMAVSQISFDRIASRIKSSRRYIMDASPGVAYKKPAAPPKAWIDTVYAYDFETSTADGFIQVVEGVSVMRVPLVGDGSRITKDSPCQKFFGETATDGMLAWVLEDAKSIGLATAQLFAHNGGRFDTLLVLGQATGVSWDRQLSAGGSIKQLEGHFKADSSVKVLFKDSCAFVQQSLKEIGESFRCAVKKLEGVNIAARDHQWFVENADRGECWKQYMDQDVQALGCVLVTLEGHLRNLSQSCTTTCGISAVAWNLIMHNSAAEFSNVEITRCPVMQAFHGAATYGGRVIHWRRRFKAGVTEIDCPRLGKYKPKGLIVYDANSLYPYVMAEFDYPYGTAKVVQEGSPEEKMAAFRDARAAGHLFIAEVTMDAGNQRYPLTPHRDENGSVRYPAGEFTGVYTSVDIDEAISQGYVVKAVARMTLWEKRCNMFRGIIEHLYRSRAAYKSQGNSFEYVLKIVLNSMYGKFRETVKSAATFAQQPELRGRRVLGKPLPLPNGQTRVTMAIPNARSRKPTYIAAFILSYSKLHMNKLIRKLGPENIFYGDTDSIVATIESGRDIKTAEGLGEFKNDHGTFNLGPVNAVDLLYKEAYFLDLKRYLGIFNIPKKGCYFKAKFNGLSWKRDDVLADFCAGTELAQEGRSQKDLVRAVYTHLLDGGEHATVTAIVDRWKRAGYSVHIETSQRSTFAISPGSRAQWRGDDFYPLGYDFGKPQAPVFAGPPIEPARTPSKKYVSNVRSVHLPHPLAGDNWFGLWGGIPAEKNETACTISRFACTGQQVVIRLGRNWHRYTPFGPAARVCSADGGELERELPGVKPLFTAPPAFSPLSPKVTPAELLQFKRLLARMLANAPAQDVDGVLTFTVTDVYEDDE